MRMTGERLEVLLIEAERHRQALVDVLAVVRGHLHQHLHIPEMQQLLAQINLFHVVLPENENMARERMHLTLNKERNRGETERMRRKRAMALQERGDQGKYGLIDDNLTDEQMAEILRTSGVMKTTTPQIPQTPQILNIEPTLPGAERLKAANERFKQETLTIIAEAETDE